MQTLRWMCAAMALVLFASAADAQGNRPRRANEGANDTEAAALDPDAPLEAADLPRHAEAPLETSDGRWYQILSSTYPGARLSSVTVDPRDPQRFYVGTEQGLVLRTEDGGITWEELEPRSTVIRTSRDQGPPPLQFDFREDTWFAISSRPPFLPSSPTLALFEGMPNVNPQASALRGGIASYLTRSAIVTNIAPLVPTSLKDSLIRRRTQPIQRLQVCPGAAYELLAASPTELFGSDDDGFTWRPLLRLPSTGKIAQIACHASRPQDIFVSTDLGIFYSTDGGQTLELDTSGFPPGRATALHISDDGLVTVSIGYMLFEGTPQDGFRRLYPRFEDSHTAPWRVIEWVARDGDVIWIATRDGLRSSYDGGQRWENVAPTRFSRHYTTQVIMSPTPDGGRQIAVLARICPPRVRSPLARGCRATEVMATTDDGESWHPFFLGMTPRSVQFLTFTPPEVMANQRASLTEVGAQDATTPEEPKGRWLVVTGGELWTSQTVGQTVFAPETRDWARRRLQWMPDLDESIEAGLQSTLLDNASIESLLDRTRRSALIPQVQSLFRWNSGQRLRFSENLVTPERTFDDENTNYWSINVVLRWSLSRTVQSREQMDRTRQRLYWQRRRIHFVVEDAWHERRMLLERLLLGTENLLQAAIIRARIDALDALLGFYTGEILPDDPQ